MFLKVETAVQAEEKGKKELDDMRQQLSLLTSQVGQLTSILTLTRRINFPQETKQINKSTKKKLEDAGLILEK
jgi:predicted AAA+ superfamily ATPase